MLGLDLLKAQSSIATYSLHSNNLARLATRIKQCAASKHASPFQLHHTPNLFPSPVYDGSVSKFQQLKSIFTFPGLVLSALRVRPVIWPPSTILAIQWREISSRLNMKGDVLDAQKLVKLVESLICKALHMDEVRLQLRLGLSSQESSTLFSRIECVGRYRFVATVSRKRPYFYMDMVIF